MSKQITTTTILRTELEQDTSVEVKAKTALKKCKEAGYTHNKAGKAITEQGLARLSKAMLRDIKNSKQGWWSTFKIVEGKDNKIKIVSKN